MYVHVCSIHVCTYTGQESYYLLSRGTESDAVAKLEGNGCLLPVLLQIALLCIRRDLVLHIYAGRMPALWGINIQLGDPL